MQCANATFEHTVVIHISFALLMVTQMTVLIEIRFWANHHLSVHFSQIWKS